jgi:hypothetical protein
MTAGENQTDLEQIRELEARAAQLKVLLEKRSADRPLIVEFSGAPKAGKTRSDQDGADSHAAIHEIVARQSGKKRD